MNAFSNNIKTAGICLTLALAAIATGCRKDFLDRDAQGAYTVEDYPYPPGSGPYDTYLFAAYSDLRAYNIHSQYFIAATSIRSDDADKGSTPADGGANAQSMDNFPVLPNNGYLNGLWTGYLELVNKCNIAIDNIRNNENIEASEPIKAQSEAEARFVRGYAYFMLVRLFDRVPIIDRVIEDVSELNLPQNSSQEIYAFVEQDLRYAAGILPASWEDRFIGRPTSGAANGLMAKVFLTQQRWSEAMSAANMVMNSGMYDLSTPYATIFSEEGENSRESVFEVQATATAQIPTDLGVQYASIQGVRGAGVWNMGWGWNTPSVQLENAYEAGDPRRARTILYTSDSSTQRTTIYGEVLPVGLPNPRYNHKVYTSPAYRNRIRNLSGYWMNIRILRYADVVLMFAEAANEMGGAANIEAARNALNSVRARARAGNANILPDVATNDQDELREAIRHERRIELAMEHDRFFDIVRWGIAEDVLHAAGKTNFRADRDGVLPIPQTQLDISGGVLTQNPNY